MTYYSRDIKMPKTKLEGLQNFVQIIINNLEAEKPSEALLVAVDLLDDLSSKSNPYAEITDGKGNAQIRALEQAHAASLSEAIAKAYAQGIEKGQAQERARIASVLGVAA